MLIMDRAAPISACHKNHVMFFIILLIATPFTLFTSNIYHFIQFYNHNTSMINLQLFFTPYSIKPIVPTCTNSLSEMVKGQWISKNVSERERFKVERFLSIARGKFFIPTTLARPDGICGNTTFEFLRKLQHQALWFRPLCDPDGPVPCCFKNRCVYKTVEECRCKDCFDMRAPINAELADWTPTNPNCDVTQFSSKEACELFKGAQVYYVGDSFLRQVYTATVSILTGNFMDSALSPSTPVGWRRYCSGWMQLVCYKYINYRAPVCGGKAHVEHVELIKHEQGGYLLTRLRQTSNVTRTIFFVGIGIHGTYNERNVWNNFLSPAVRFVQENSKVNISWPRFVWMSPHAPGIMKTPRVPGQNYESVLRYNAFINAKLRQAGIPILDTFNMTDGVMSFDGAHYGFGINMLKSQILMNHLNELKRSDL